MPINTKKTPMKHTKTLLNSLLILALISTNVQGQAFEQGNIIISAGYGYGSKGLIVRLIEEEIGANANFSSKYLGPIVGKFEYGASDKVGVGISFNYKSFDLSYSDYGSVDTVSIYKAGYKGAQMSVLARMNLHFGTTEKVDWYWGLGLGYRSGSRTFYSDEPNGSSSLSFKNFIPIGFETTVGMRYFFTPNIGIYIEAGLAQALAQGGLAVKF